MGLTRLCKRVFRACKPKSRRKPKRPRRPKFKHVADTPPENGACLLLALPAEIRYRILEHTLCQKDPIQARESAQPNVPFDGSYVPNLESLFDVWMNGKPCLEVLRTCRQLHDEGTDIFYKKNTFGITIFDPGWGGYNEVDFLGLGNVASAFTRLPRLKDCPNLKLTFILATNAQCSTLGVCAYKDAIDQPIQQLQRQWQACGRLDVEVISKCGHFPHHGLEAAFLFHKLGILRCKGVWFRGLPYSLTSTLTRLIESDLPVKDLQHAYRELCQYLEVINFSDRPRGSTYTAALQTAENAAAKFDEVEFMNVRKEVIELASAHVVTNTEIWLERGNELKDSLPALEASSDMDDDDISVAMMAQMWYG